MDVFRQVLLQVCDHVGVDGKQVAAQRLVDSSNGTDRFVGTIDLETAEIPYGGFVASGEWDNGNSDQLNGLMIILCKPEWDGKSLVRVCTNGSSELMSNISMSVIGMLYNAQLMKYAGEDGVAAYGTIMYPDRHKHRLIPFERQLVAATAASFARH